jgi:hypothetical protein
MLRMYWKKSRVTSSMGRVNMEKINMGDFTAETLDTFISDLKYRSYAYNRQRSPEIEPDRWSKIYGVDAYLYEVIYQKSGGKDAGQ